MEGQDPSVGTKRIKLDVLVPIDTNLTRVKGKRESEEESQELEFEIQAIEEVSDARFSRDPKRTRRVSAALEKAQEGDEEMNPPDDPEMNLFGSENDPPSTRFEFLAEIRKDILDEIMEKTSDTTRNRKTQHSVIQDYNKVIQYYENMQPPFEKISVKNAMVVNATSVECKVCGCKYSARCSTQMTEHIQVKHMFLKRNICMICQTTFTTKSNLTKHMQTIHIALPIGSTIFYEDGSKNISCKEFNGFDGNEIRQLYFITWMKKNGEEEEVMGISVEMTACKSVQFAASELWLRNESAAKLVTAGMDNTGCSFRHWINCGWVFNPENAKPMGIYGLDEPTGATLKFTVRTVLGAKCHQKPMAALIRSIKCQEEIFKALRLILPQIPKKNQFFFNNKEWETETASEVQEPNKNTSLITEWKVSEIARLIRNQP